MTGTGSFGEAAALEARLYDLLTPDWPGEIAFYEDRVREAGGPGIEVLEVACGTGRVALRLASAGAWVTGLDRSSEMLAIARQKAASMTKATRPGEPGRADFALADMRDFDLGRTFPLVLVTGHAFMHMLTPLEQFECLCNLKRHLAPGGRLVIHIDNQNVAWLGGLIGLKSPSFGAPSTATDPSTGTAVRVSRGWAYEPSSQTNVLTSRFEELDASGKVAKLIESAPVPIHCLFRYEMEHLFARSGMKVEDLFGDFLRAPLADGSTEMVWVARVS